MNRTVIFAHYDNENKIADYVIYYLAELKKISKEIIFVSDCNLEEKELDKINKYITKAIAKHHGEYDFGSYKIGYTYAKENKLLETSKELIFVNDSCFGPFYPLDKIFETMNNSINDFWGISINDIDVASHIQSFFLVFKENVFKNAIFDDFINSIKKERTKEKIVEKYEIGLTQYLFKNGFTYDAFNRTRIESKISQNTFCTNKPVVLLKKSEIIKLHNPIINFVLAKIDKLNLYPKNYIIKYSNEKIQQKSLKDSLKAMRRIIIQIKISKRTISILGKKFQF